jgi:glutaredoxin
MGIPIIEIYSTITCSHCLAAKELLDRGDYVYQEHKVGMDITVDKFYEMMDEVDAPHTVPQIFVDGEYIGGYNALVEKMEADNM